MRCQRCDTDHPASARFCDACGGGLVSACPSCRVPARPGARFCSQCGAAMGSSAIGGAATGGTAEPPAAPVPAPMSVGERKHVTILFADVRGSTRLIRDLDPEEALARIDPVVQAAAAAVTRFGGIVNEFQGDGIMALFGAPMAAEDHPVRACLAAMALLHNLPPDIEMRVGIHSGEVVVRPSGRDASDYAAIGPAVYFAKRLEQAAAPGTAVLSTETAQHTRGYTDLRPLGPVQAKGWDEPVEMFELLAATARPSWEVRSAGSLSPFVGRDAEIGSLSAALMRATLGRAQAVVLVADPGLGKSRLAHEFLQTAAARGVRVLRAAAAVHTQEAPFHIAAELMRSWIGALPGDDQAALQRRLNQATAIGNPREVDEAALRSLLDLPLADPAAWIALAPAARRRRLLDACRRVILRGAAQRTRIVLVEDLHWLDEPSRALLDELVTTAGAARLLVLATTRPEVRPDWAGRSYAAEMHLAPLDGAQSDALLQSLVGDGQELATLRARVVASAEGTPLFLEEISRALLESGALRTRPSRQWLSVSVDQVEIPASVQAIVASRLDRLAHGPRSLLLTMSVIGKDVRTDVLRRVAQLGDDELRAGLMALQVAEFIYEVSPGTGAEYTFKHAVTQGVAYEAVLRAERRALHGRVFTALLDAAGDRADEWTDRLAEHATAGELWDQAVEYGALAAERARARYAWREAVRYFDLALAALSHMPDKPQTFERSVPLRSGLRVALTMIGDFQRGADVMEDASVAAYRHGHEVSAAQFDGTACMMLTSLGKLDRAITLGRRGAAVASRMGHIPTAVSLGFGLGQAHWFRGEFAEAIAVLTDRLPDIRGPHRTSSAGTTGNAALMSLVCLSKAHAMRGEFGQAHILAEEATCLARETGQPYDLSYAPIASGFAYMLQGCGDAAVGALEAGLSVAKRAGILLLVPSIARYLGRAYAMEGKFAPAYNLLDEALACTRTNGLVSLSAWCGTAMASVHLAARSSEVAQVAADAGALAAQHGYRPVEAICLRLSAAGHLESGAFAKAASEFETAIEMLASMQMQPERAMAQHGLSQALEALGRSSQAAAIRAAADISVAMAQLDPVLNDAFNTCVTKCSETR